MPNQQDGYVWIKMARSPEPYAPATPAGGDGAMADPAALETLLSAWDADAANSLTVSRTGLAGMWGSRPQGLYLGRAPATPGLHAFARLDRDYNGARGCGSRAELAAQVPLGADGQFTSRSEAIAWLVTQDGQAWLADAAQYALLCITLTDSEVLPTRPASAGGLSLAPPSAYTGAECQTLQSDARAYAGRRAEIEAEAGLEQDAIWPVQRVLGSADLGIKPATKMLVGEVLAGLRGPVAFFKAEYDKPSYGHDRPYPRPGAHRPGHCQGMVPPYPADRLPQHASYPGGHAAMAFALAAVYAAVFPVLKGALQRAAARVARNREIAGLHYAADTQGGKTLGEAYARQFIADARFPELKAAVQAEWVV